MGADSRADVIEAVRRVWEAAGKPSPWSVRAYDAARVSAHIAAPSSRTVSKSVLWPDVARAVGFVAASTSWRTRAPTSPAPATSCVDLDYDDVADTGPAPAAEQPKPPPDALVMHRLRRELDDAKRRERDLLARLDAAERVHVDAVALGSDATPLGVQARERVFGLREATAVALASDWHLEELVDPAVVSGVNAYDLATADRSARRFFESIVWLIESHQGAFAIRDLLLWLGGDIISGVIHDELLESNQLAPLEAMRFAREVIVRGIRMMLDELDLEQIIIPCNDGNHGRTTHKIRVSTRTSNSYETALYHQLAQDFANEPRVRFSVARGELLYLNVYEYTLRFTHGDAVRYGGGVGGITIPINKAVSQWDAVRRADLTCMGHWHSLTWARRVAVNGSLIGYGPYSVRIKADFEPPRQAFFLIDSRRGVCQQTPIWVRSDDHEHELDPAESHKIRQRLLVA